MRLFAAPARPFTAPVAGWQSRLWGAATEAVARLRAAIRCGVFVVAMIPSRRRPADRVTRRPVIDRVPVTTARGTFEVDLYRPPTQGPHPGVVASFGVNPTGAPDARVAQMGNALARSGFAALLYWPPTARDIAIEPADVDELVSAFSALLDQPTVDTSRSGFCGICVGGAVALLASARPAIRERVAFVCAYAPYASMRTLAIEIAGRTATPDARGTPWAVDPLTWAVYVRTVTGWLEPAESQRLREAFEGQITWNATKTEVLHAPSRPIAGESLSADGRAALRLLSAGADDVEAALDGLPPAARDLLSTMSPISWLEDIAAPRIMVLHDRDDHVIPVDESRRLWRALAGRPGASYSELGLRHLRMPAAYSPARIVRELWRSYLAWYPLFLESTGSSRRRST
jgi:hypothetical protein